jgi:hypothetical protein
MLTAPRVLAMMIAGLCTSLQAALDDMFGQINEEGVRIRACSDRAFAKARRGLSAQAFVSLNSTLLQIAAPLIDAHRWYGLRVVAADGSRLRVSTRRGADLGADHYAFALYLPGAEVTLHAALDHADACERQMLFDALDATHPEDLLVLDRGLIGNTMAAAIVQQQRQFCMRVDATGYACVKNFLSSGKAQAIVVLDAPRHQDCVDYALDSRPTTVRLIRDVTPGGTVRVLMTSLIDCERFPVEAFGALYHRRWRIEEAFKRIKHRLRLEAVSGLTYLAFQQDFSAKIIADNLHTLLASANEPLSYHEQVPSQSRPNRTAAFGALRPILIGCLLRVDSCLTKLHKVIDLITSTRCRIQQGRSYPRKQRAKPHLYSSYKLWA